MKVIITGSTSSITQKLKPSLSDFCEVVTIGRKNCDIVFDLRNDINTIDLPLNTDTIIHTAAEFGGMDDNNFLNTLDVNVLGTLKICQLAHKIKAKHLIIISSIFSKLDSNSEFYNIYSLSKKQSEEVATLYCNLHNIPLTILQPSQLYGVDISFKTHQPFFYSIIEKAKYGQNIDLYGSHSPLRNFLFIDDLIDIIIKIIQNPIVGIFSCQNKNDVSYSQIAEAAYNVYNTSGEINFMKDKPTMHDNIFHKDENLYEKINFYPQISIEEGIKKIAESNCIN